MPTKRRRPRKAIGPTELICGVCSRTVPLYSVDLSAVHGMCCGFLYLSSYHQTDLRENGIRLHAVHINQISQVFWQDFDFDTLEMGKSYRFRRIFLENQLGKVMRGVFCGMGDTKLGGLQLRFRLKDNEPFVIDSFQIRDLEEVDCL